MAKTRKEKLVKYIEQLLAHYLNAALLGQHVPL